MILAALILAPIALLALLRTRKARPLPTGEELGWNVVGAQISETTRNSRLQ